jgi:hypothetical protein
MKPAHGTVSIEIDGKTYRGDYTVFSRDAPMITVVGYGDLGGRTKTTQLGDSPPEGLARIMLRELVEDTGQPVHPQRGSPNTIKENGRTKPANATGAASPELPTSGDDEGTPMFFCDACNAEMMRLELGRPDDAVPPTKL